MVERIQIGLATLLVAHDRGLRGCLLNSDRLSMELTVAIVGEERQVVGYEDERHHFPWLRKCVDYLY